MVTLDIRVSDLRRAYMPGKKKTGRVDVSAVGLTYRGQPISTIEFARHDVVRYYGAEESFCFATFNGNGVGLDD